ncbi:hypothetical protein Cni_G16069 [Canna indica]|uniref:Uncharacterized protein n=1 Tax=Canna indica TaxID=4628 RepID=A0AAQ3KEI5_9LILI|nr:hypothetical protein Cni_G16069 [Canna indica]
MIKETGLRSNKVISSKLLQWPPLPRSHRPAVVRSVTRDEINQYWQIKRMDEEDHLLAAEKAAARIRAKALKEDDYRRFEESLKETEDGDRKKGELTTADRSDDKELWIGIKDWWTKSKFAYLNQPAIKSMEEKTIPVRPTSTYTPQYSCFCDFPPAVQLYTSTFGIFR